MSLNNLMMNTLKTKKINDIKKDEKTINGNWKTILLFKIVSLFITARYKWVILNPNGNQSKKIMTSRAFVL